MPTKWLQERTNGSKNAPGIGFEGPGVVPLLLTGKTSQIDYAYYERESKIPGLVALVKYNPEPETLNPKP
jgi:hypothetical protein